MNLSKKMTNTARQTGVFPVLLSFMFAGKVIRGITDDAGYPQVVAKDVAEALGYTWTSNGRIAHVPEEWKGVAAVVTSAGTLEMVTLTEPGLYCLLNRSDKPTAEPMRKWLAGEVIPALRRIGSPHVQRTPQAIAKCIHAQADIVIELVERMKPIIGELAALIAKLDLKFLRMNPNVYARRDMKCQGGDLRISDTAELLGTGCPRLYRFLRQQGVLSSDPETWNQPVRRYVDAGYLIGVRETHGASAVMTKTEVLVTSFGRLWLHENACQGRLDGILDREALVDRAPTAVGFPLPLIDINPKSS